MTCAPSRPGQDGASRKSESLNGITHASFRSYELAFFGATDCPRVLGFGHCLDGQYGLASLDLDPASDGFLQLRHQPRRHRNHRSAAALPDRDHRLQESVGGLAPPRRATGPCRPAHCGRLTAWPLLPPGAVRARQSSRLFGVVPLGRLPGEIAGQQPQAGHNGARKNTLMTFAIEHAPGNRQVGILPCQQRVGEDIDVRHHP